MSSLIGHDLPHRARDLRAHRLAPCRNVVIGERCLRRLVGDEHIEPLLDPAVVLRLERHLLMIFEARDGLFVLLKKAQVVSKVERRLLDFRIEATTQAVATQLEDLIRADGIEPQLVEEVEQPWLTRRERGGRLHGIPHLGGATHELIAARTLHAIDAQVRTTDAYRVLGRPRAGGVVFRRDHTVARVDWRGHGRAQVHVAQAEHEVVGVEDDAPNVIDAVKAIDAPDELRVRGAPRRIGARGFLVTASSELRLRVVPRER